MGSVLSALNKPIDEVGAAGCDQALPMQNVEEGQPNPAGQTRNPVGRPRLLRVSLQAIPSAAAAAAAAATAATAATAANNNAIAPIINDGQGEAALETNRDEEMPNEGTHNRSEATPAERGVAEPSLQSASVANSSSDCWQTVVSIRSPRDSGLVNTQVDMAAVSKRLKEKAKYKAKTQPKRLLHNGPRPYNLRSQREPEPPAEPEVPLPMELLSLVPSDSTAELDERSVATRWSSNTTAGGFKRASMPACSSKKPRN